MRLTVSLLNVNGVPVSAIPVRAVVSPKTCDKGVVEVSYRDKSFKGEVAIDTAAVEIKGMVERLLKQLEI